MRFAGGLAVPAVSGRIRLEQYLRDMAGEHIVVTTDVVDITYGESYVHQLMANPVRTFVGVDISDKDPRCACMTSKNNSHHLSTRACWDVAFSTISFDVVAVSKKIRRLFGKFEFWMPWLAECENAVQLALFNGAKYEQLQAHMIHGAVYLRAHREAVAADVIGIPMMDTRLSVDDAPQVAVA